MTETVKSSRKFSSEFIERWKYAQAERAELDRISDIHNAKMEERSNNALALIKNGASLDLIIKSLGITKNKLLDLARKNNIEIKEQS